MPVLDDDLRHARDAADVEVVDARRCMRLAVMLDGTEQRLNRRAVNQRLLVVRFLQHFQVAIRAIDVFLDGLLDLLDFLVLLRRSAHDDFSFVVCSCMYYLEKKSLAARLILFRSKYRGWLRQP